MIYYAVIDTNVLISGMLKKNSIPNIIIRKAIAENIIPIFNEEILQEYREVTARPKFQFPSEAVSNLLDCIVQRGILQPSKPFAIALPDEKDRSFYETVMAGRIDYNAYLITGNLKHFPNEHFIVNPHQMLEIIET